MRIEEFFDVVDFDPEDFDTGALGAGPLLWLILKPKEPVPKFHLKKKRKRKGKRFTRQQFFQKGMPLPSPQFLRLLDVLDNLGYLELLVTGR